MKLRKQFYYRSIKKNKIVGSKCTKRSEDLNMLKNFRTPLKEINLNKWKDIACSWIRELNIVKMTGPPILIQSRHNP